MDILIPKVMLVETLNPGPEDLLSRLVEDVNYSFYCPALLTVWSDGDMILVVPVKDVGEGFTAYAYLLIVRTPQYVYK